jgi:hypothetical protein
VTRLDEDRPAPAMRVAAIQRRHNLPAPLTRMIGRSEVVSIIASRLLQRRSVTIVGPGGIGKTTVALAAADKLSPSYKHGACFVDLASIVDPLLVPSALASVLGLEILSEDPTPALLAFLGDKHLMIVLDNCEHVVAAASALAEKVLWGAPGVHVLATSREPLRSEGEWVHRLSPLAIPTVSTTLTAAQAVAFPAIQLFVERAMASSDSFELHDADVSIVADVCRRLDGIPLAIELAAARIDLFGLQGLFAQLEDCLRLLTKGRRTALPRLRRSGPRWIGATGSSPKQSRSSSAGSRCSLEASTWHRPARSRWIATSARLTCSMASPIWPRNPSSQQTQWASRLFFGCSIRPAFTPLKGSRPTTRAPRHAGGMRRIAILFAKQRELEAPLLLRRTGW